MTQNLTPKQERFAQKYIELGNASEAYRLSYDAKKMKPEVIHVKACELLKDGKVAVRVAELQAIHQKRHEVTVDSLTEEYEEIRKLALEDKQYAPATSAITGKAKLHGLLSENTVTVNLQPPPLPEKDRALLKEYAGTE
jgi:phage terminase small subunit